MNVFEIEEKNLRRILGFENAKIIGRTIVAITKDLYHQVEFVLFYKQDKQQQLRSRQQIGKIKQDLKKGDVFPAIAIRRFPDYNHVVDGMHRVMAFYEYGKKEHEALQIR